MGKSRACAPGRRDWLLGDVMGEIFEAASWSSCSESLATFTSQQAEHLPVCMGTGLKGELQAKGVRPTASQEGLEVFPAI